jgi:ABC-type uncharacterized transport system involved in gliding motility auxiliary subunit
MNSSWLKTRQTKYAGFLAVYVAVILAVVVIANLLADRYNVRYDGTANKRYSLSDQTLKIIKRLKQDATIMYFDRPTRYTAPPRGSDPGSPTVKDLLGRYANISSKVHVQFINPDQRPDLAREAGAKAYGTTIVQVGDRKEEAKSLNEDGITGALIRDIKTAVRTVCLVTGSGEAQIDVSDRSGLSLFKTLLERDNFVSRSINLLKKAEVPTDCTVLVLAGPSGDYEQPEMDAIKKYIEDGGRALFMLNPPLTAGRTAIADNNALTNLIQSFGVTLDRNLVLEVSAIGRLQGLGPETVLVLNYPPHVIVNDLKGSATGFPITRSMQIKNTDKATVEKLIESSEGSVATSNLSTPAMNDPNNKPGPFTLAAAATYKPSATITSRIVVFGGVTWVQNNFIRFNGNSDLALNTINWLSSDEDIIGVHSKPQEDRRIELSASNFRWVRATSQFLLPLSIVIVGLLVWIRRRNES